MQINRIGAISKLNHNIIKNNKTSRINFNLKNDSFEKSNAISFKGENEDTTKYSVDWGYENIYFPDENGYILYFPRQRKLNILNGDEEQLRNVAESLCLYSNEDIENFTKIYLPLRLAENPKKSEKAYAKLFPYIQEQRVRFLNLMDLEQKLVKKQKRRALKEDEQNTLQILREEIKRISKKCSKAKSEYLYPVTFEPVSDDDNVWQNID